MIREAVISDDGKFRYSLLRAWRLADPFLLVVMLNPSTADAQADDPTITRLLARADAEGFNGFVVCNLYAYRATHPTVLEQRWANAQEIIGPENNRTIAACAAHCSQALVAWGSHPLVRKREQTVLNILYSRFPRLVMIDKTKDGYPRHPLHVGYDVRFQSYTGRFANSLTL